ncbi:CDP-glycerol glycerophosphotransferase family protein [Selenomonas ruminantium]|nr:CDP-glycerol glycerophosphotransferase family protein [Selenomonas ruminantium]
MAENEHPQKLHPILHRLTEVRDLCQMGLTKSNYDVRYGEAYDTLIMAIKQILSGKAGKDAGEIVGLCKELLEHIMAETDKEKHFKKEMVFLPYKASMWDSLESVWRAAYEDKDNCLAYVIPIPYCDRNPDGTAKEWHCERDLFPKDVPTLDWQEVDLKTMHPDVIFFHYPYDDCNRVTSPSEEFYSSNLKKCADKLVYIPYFVTGKELKPNFIQEPGVNNADYVIVENEKIKAIYEEYYSGGELPEGKILALGSPKYDKVIASRKEDYPLPEAWERLVAGRKIILYNTSLQAHLIYSNRIIEKLYSVLLYFRSRKDLAFWWRPHPLMEATLDSMIPQVASVYRELRDAYLKEGWGIYDDTPELERAIAWSDAYYGDTSSVVELYSKTGKPIMIQDMEVTNIA